MANNFEFYTVLRGHHVYSNTVTWIPYVGQKITFKREHNNPYDKFAVAGKVTMKEKIGLIVVGHAPRKLSPYIWFFTGEGAKFEVEVHEEKPMASLLAKGRLEIPTKVSVTWDEPEKMSILVAKVKEVKYPLTGEYADDSKNILKESGIKEDEDDDDDVKFQTEKVNNEDIQML